MTPTVDLESPKVIRKVRAATYGASAAAAVGVQITPLLSDPLANVVVRLVPFWDSEIGFLAVATLLDLIFVGILAGVGALGGGYYVRSRPEDLIPRELA